MVMQIAAGEQARFKQEHLQEVAALVSEEGIWLDVNVLFTIGAMA
jgi:hypothetical protein